MSVPAWVEAHRMRMRETGQQDSLECVVPEGVQVTLRSRRGGVVKRWVHQLDAGRLDVAAVMRAAPSCTEAVVGCYAPCDAWDNEVRVVASDAVVEWPATHRCASELSEVLVVATVVAGAPRRTRRQRHAHGPLTRRKLKAA